MDAQRTAAALGIDFGTHNTVATVLRTDGRRHQLLFDGSPLLPSGIYIDYEASLLVGRDAAREGRRHPARYERNPKLQIGSPTILLGDREVAVHDAVAAVIARALSECAQAAGPPRSVTVTVPAGWGPARRHVVGDAAVSAGAANLTLLPEPVAAARYFVEVLGHEAPPGSAMVVFDLGAGTFDASVVARTGTGYEVLAVDGSDRVGGHYLDQAIVDYLGGRFETSEDSRERWRALLDPNAGTERQRLRFALYDEVRDAKERLSRSVTTELAVPGFSGDELLTRSELELLARPMLAQAVETVKAVLREAGLEPDRLAGIFMVGGASRMPLAATMLHRELGIAPTLLEQPELVVSEGAVSFPAPATTPMTAAPPLAAPTQVLPAGLIPQQNRREKGLIYALVALAAAVLAGGASLIYAYGNQNDRNGSITGVDATTSSAAEATSEAAEEVSDWDDVSVTGIETTATSITVRTDAAADLGDCTARIESTLQGRLAEQLDCGEAVFGELYASSDFEIWIYGPGEDFDDPESTPLIVRESTDIVSGEVYWDCPQSLHYCSEQGGEPGISPEPERGLDALEYAPVHQDYELVCFTSGDLIVPRGSDDVDGYHDYHPDKQESDLWVRLELDSASYGYIPFVWLVVDHDDLDSTGDLPAC